MADIVIKRDSEMAATYVPNSFIDEYMTQADGEFVKIYLYLLRCMSDSDRPFSISDTADRFEDTERDVRRALKYWERMNLLRLEFNDKKELTGICMMDSTASATASSAAKAPSGPEISPAAGIAASGSAPEATSPAAQTTDAPAAQDVSVTQVFPATDPPQQAAQDAFPDKARETKTAPDAPEASKATAGRLPERTQYTRDELSQFVEDETVQELLFITERYLGHPLNNNETQTILYWLDKLRFSQDLIEYLIEDCVSKNHKSIRYMDKVALSWAEQGIHTLGDAKDASGTFSQSVHTVMKAFGITGRSLVNFERDYVKKWSKELGFPCDIIACACQRTIRSTHQISFEYADSILNSWKKQNVYTMKDIEVLDAQYQEMQARRRKNTRETPQRATAGASARRIANFPQRTYDFDKLEAELLTR